jgi:hypothetical protein
VLSGWVGVAALAIVAALVALTFYWIFRLRRGDQLPNTRRLRIGFFVERDRYVDEQQRDDVTWPQPPE